MNVITAGFKRSFKSLPFVFQKTSIYFGFYYLAASIFFLLSLNHFFPDYQEISEVASYWINMSLAFLAQAFLVFIVPYYTYKHAKGPDIRPFWTFVANTVWPLVLSYIKAFFILIFFFILLIIPGIYKSVRYSFISQTVFFDELSKKEGLSPLKGSDKSTRGYFWLIFLAGILLTILSAVLTVLCPFLVKIFLPVPDVGIQALTVILGFYTSCFTLLFFTHFYFEIKERRGESVSC